MSDRNAIYPHKSRVTIITDKTSEKCSVNNGQFLRHKMRTLPVSQTAIC